MNYMTVAEFRDRFLMSKSTFYRKVNEGLIRLTKIGRSTRISEADAAAFAASLPVRGGDAFD